MITGPTAIGAAIRFALWPATLDMQSTGFVVRFMAIVFSTTFIMAVFDDLVTEIRRIKK
jgi:hypothetical protein